MMRLAVLRYQTSVLHPGGEGISAAPTAPRPVRLLDEVRRALQLQPGDELEYQVIDGHVILTKAHGGQKTDDPFRTFDEWSSKADEEAYGKL